MIRFLRTLTFTLLSLAMVACQGTQITDSYKYVAAANGSAPATIERMSVLEDKDKTKLVRVRLISINGAPLGASKITQIAPGRTKLHVSVENVKRNNVKPVTVEFEFEAKAKEKYRFDIAGDEWTYIVMLKDSKGKVLLEKEFMKAAVIRRSILDL